MYKNQSSYGCQLYQVSVTIRSHSRLS